MVRLYPAAVDQLLFSTWHVRVRRQVYRIVTGGFVHADWMHLIFNAYTLYAFGQSVELAFGSIVFAAIYFSAIIGGDLLSLVLHWRTPYRVLGASGGVCGIVFAHIFVFPGGSIYMLPLPVAIPSWLYAIGSVVFSFFGSRYRIGNVGHDAHLGGALVELATATMIEPEIMRYDPRIYWLVVGLSLILLVMLYRGSTRTGPTQSGAPLGRLVRSPIG